MKLRSYRRAALPFVEYRVLLVYFMQRACLNGINDSVTMFKLVFTLSSLV